jgi:cytosine/uracil/thiamine/allantoin permease
VNSFFFFRYHSFSLSLAHSHTHSLTFPLGLKIFFFSFKFYFICQKKLCKEVQIRSDFYLIIANVLRIYLFAESQGSGALKDREQKKKLFKKFYMSFSFCASCMIYFLSTYTYNFFFFASFSSFKFTSIHVSFSK